MRKGIKIKENQIIITVPKTTKAGYCSNECCLMKYNGNTCYCVLDLALHSVGPNFEKCKPNSIKSPSCPNVYKIGTGKGK
jgi:hypothetical protein